MVSSTLQHEVENSSSHSINHLRGRAFGGYDHIVFPGCSQFFQYLALPFQFVDGQFRFARVANVWREIKNECEIGLWQKATKHPCQRERCWSEPVSLRVD
jgi:hypothetical protein